MWLAAAAAVVVAATAPFLLPYLAVRQHGFRPRPLEEVRRYSADVYSYLRGLDDSIWRGWLTDFTREEGTLFPGLVPVVLAAVGIAAAVRQALVRARTVLPAALWRQTAATLLGGVAALSLLLALFELFAGPAIQRIRDLWFPLALVGNVLAVFGMAVVGWLASSPRARLAACAACRCPPVFFLGIAAVAVWLSFGPVVETKGFRLTDQSVYVWL